MIKYKLLKELTLKYDLGTLIDVKFLKSSQNNVFKITTDKSSYVIKEYTKDAIGNYYYLKKRKKQIEISELLNQNGIKTIIPLSYDNKNFLLHKNKYYLIYNYSKDKTKSSEELGIENIHQLALTQSKIHKLNLKYELPCSYKYINIDLEKQLKLASKIDKNLYKKINNEKDNLNNIITNCNRYLKNMRKNLCISHNDFKLLNILWRNEEPVLIDFDATGLSNATCCLCESAFTFSNYKNSINYNFYKEYLKTYLEEYGTINENYIEALYVSFNGKLQWLKYMFSKNHLKNNNYINETIHMIDELILYYNNIDQFYEIFEKIKILIK